MSVLVIGGTGFFGAIISRLFACPGVRETALRAVSREGRVAGGISELIIGARNVSRCAALADALRPGAGDLTISAVEFDSLSDKESLVKKIRSTNASVLINAAGPYSTTPAGLQHGLAAACIQGGVHYIDLADSSVFVAAVRALHGPAARARVVAVSGCSTLPTISGAVAEELTAVALGASPEDVKAISLGITPGWKSPRGIGTSRSILSTVGKPVTVLQAGQWVDTHVWGDNHKHRFPPPLGDRWLANLDVPDLKLWTKTYPNVQTVQAFAGLELPLFHLGTAFLGSTLGRMGVDLGRWPIADVLHKTTERLHMLGTLNGGMFVRVELHDGRSAVWNLAALDSALDGAVGGGAATDVLPAVAVGPDGDWPGQTQMRGPRIPCLPAVLLAQKLLYRRANPAVCESPRPGSAVGGDVSLSGGAGPCTELIAYREVHQLLNVLGIHTSVEVFPSDSY